MTILVVINKRKTSNYNRIRVKFIAFFLIGLLSLFICPCCHIPFATALLAVPPIPTVGAISATIGGIKVINMKQPLPFIQCSSYPPAAAAAVAVALCNSIDSHVDHCKDEDEQPQLQQQQPLSAAAAAVAADTAAYTTATAAILDTSTLVLLEHVNLNVPEHTYMVPFYYHVLGMGLDKRRASNMVLGKGTLWANCGSSQFHLPYGESAQVVPGMIGLLYHTLEPLKQRLQQYDSKERVKPFQTYTLEDDPRGTTTTASTNIKLQRIKIVDLFGNKFLCRLDITQQQQIQSQDLFQICQPQPNLSLQDIMDKTTQEQDILKQFILDTNKNHQQETPSRTVYQSECKGIDFVEIHVPQGTAEKIAEFYDCIFDANVSVLDVPTTWTTKMSAVPTTSMNNFKNNNDNKNHEQPTTTTTTLKVAIIAFGNIDTMGRSSQSLIFREVSNQDPDIQLKLKPYDGYHIALYVGSNAADFEQVFHNCQDAGIVWVNPRFSDAAMTLTGARTWKQFRFKDILDLKTGQVLIQLEHEVRSIEHEAFPGFIHI